MPKPGSFVEIHDGQNQAKVSFAMYADLEAILRPANWLSPSPNESYAKEVNRHIPRDSKMGLLVQTTTFRPLLWRAKADDEN